MRAHDRINKRLECATQGTHDSLEFRVPIHNLRYFDVGCRCCDHLNGLGNCPGSRRRGALAAGAKFTTPRPVQYRDVALTPTRVFRDTRRLFAQSGREDLRPVSLDQFANATYIAGINLGTTGTQRLPNIPINALTRNCTAKWS